MEVHSLGFVTYDLLGDELCDLSSLSIPQRRYSNSEHLVTLD